MTSKGGVNSRAGPACSWLARAPVAHPTMFALLVLPQVGDKREEEEGGEGGEVERMGLTPGQQRGLKILYCEAGVWKGEGISAYAPGATTTSV